jgi:hypothetical protein
MRTTAAWAVREYAYQGCGLEMRSQRGSVPAKLATAAQTDVGRADAARDGESVRYLRALLRAAKSGGRG